MEKMKKYPKMPKAGASLKTILAAEKRFKAVKTHNDGLKREEQQRKAARARLSNMKRK